jgi:4-diphosphocytidyl-2-C-methyl-D-erythritol kinase
LQSASIDTSVRKIKAPAKLNLRLKITGRRKDGYHELSSIMVPISLFDLLELRVVSCGIALQCEGIAVPADETNLVHRAARAFLVRAEIRNGVTIKLVKKIPVAAGMGGGSSDAAATLLALNRIWPRALPPRELHRIALDLGADVPFFLECKPALASGIGEILEPLAEWPTYWYVVVNPGLEVSTAWVYGRLSLALTRSGREDIYNFLKDRHFGISRVLENDLEAVTAERFPIIDTIKEYLMDAGAEGAMMTGSGPTVFGVFLSPEAAERATQHLISRRVGDVFLATNWQRP